MPSLPVTHQHRTQIFTEGNKGNRGTHNKPRQVGRNGTGKSTLLKILSRITEPSEGRAEIHGRIASLLEVGTGMRRVDESTSLQKLNKLGGLSQGASGVILK